MRTNDSASALSTQTTQAQETEKVTFTQEQQARIDEIIQSFHGQCWPRGTRRGGGIKRENRGYDSQP